MITIYSKPDCSYCDKTKALLKIHNLPYNELSVGADITVDQLKKLIPGAKSVPQIEIDGVYIGGYQQLVRYLDDRDV